MFILTSVEALGIAHGGSGQKNGKTVQRRDPLAPGDDRRILVRSRTPRPRISPWAQKKARAELEKACTRIVAAACGTQEATRHQQCFYVGGIVGRGDLDYEEAYAALLEAACAMPVYRDPWLNLEERVARSIEAGMERPLALSQTESWIRNFRARMRLQRPATSAGARNG